MSDGREYQFIFGVLVFYGFLFLIYSLNGNNLYGLNMNQLTFSTPTEPSGNVFIDLLNGAGSLIATVVSFFFALFITPFTSGLWAYFGFINWAIFGTTIYLFIKVLRGN